MVRAACVVLTEHSVVMAEEVDLMGLQLVSLCEQFEHFPSHLHGGSVRTNDSDVA